MFLLYAADLLLLIKRHADDTQVIIIIIPTYGIAEKILVITVAAQKLICPHGSTYPINALIIVKIDILSPVLHTILCGMIHI